MKKVLLLLLLIITSSMVGQEPWRTLTLSTTNGVNLKGEFISTSSINISYELKNNLSIESWTGFNYDFSSKSGWMSNQTTFNKTYKNSLSVGVGVLYNNGFVNLVQDSVNRTYGIVTIRKRFKL